jgi:non-specific serine/threonine protein kinase
MPQTPTAAVDTAGGDFTRQVRDALAHLYDPAYLQTHPLAALVSADPGLRAPGRAQALRQILIQAIEATRPIGSADRTVPGSLTYQVLTLRYVEALEPTVVQQRLGVGRSEFYREHQRGIDAVVSLLRERWGRPTVAARPPSALAADSNRPERVSRLAPRHNLPAQATRFIGRVREITEIKGWLRTTRLLTLTGTGGSGKTRLALEVGAALLDSYPDGVWLVELAPLADPALVAAAVASALEVGEGSGRTDLANIGEAIGARQLLLILDNCEHLLDACATLADRLLRSCPELRILATSREGLGIAGEVSWRVPSLTVTEDGPLPPLAELQAVEAVDLFVERARAALPGFGLTGQNAPAVAQICRRLDGIPLALELAAARLKGLSADQLAARLDQRFRLLTGGSRAALLRQQTLAAMVGWSYDLLSEAERVQFQRLAVFVGGFTLEAAEAVCAEGTGEGTTGLSSIPSTQHRENPPDVLDLLLRLVDKSLVLAESGEGGANRYRLLETLRQYAIEKLAASCASEALHARHAEYYIALAEQAAAVFLGPERAVWLPRMQRELNNVRAALRWLIDTGQVERALQLCGALHVVLYYSGFPGEIRRWLVELLTLPAAQEPTPGRAGALVSARLLAWNQLELKQADAVLDEALEILRAYSDRGGVARALAVKSMVAVANGNYGHARALAEQSLAQDPLVGGQTPGLAFIFAVEALEEACFYLADYAMAQACRDQDQAARDWTDPSDFDWRGHLATATGDYITAQGFYADAMRMRLSIDRKLGVAYTLSGLAGLAAAQGQLARAVRISGAAARLCEISGVPPQRTQEGYIRGKLPGIRKEMGVAAYDAAWTEGQAMTLEGAVAYALEEGGD